MKLIELALAEWRKTIAKQLEIWQKNLGRADTKHFINLSKNIQ